ATTCLTSNSTQRVSAAWAMSFSISAPFIPKSSRRPGTAKGTSVSLSRFAGAPLENPHLATQSVPQSVLLDLQVVANLQVQPEPLRCAEVPRQPKCGVRADRSGPVHNLVDPPRRHTRLLRQPVLADVQGGQELFQQDLAGVDRRQLAARHNGSSMVIDDFDVERVAAFPAKANAILVIDPNAVLTL